jgi:hypothetical protein
MGEFDMKKWVYIAISSIIIWPILIYYYKYYSIFFEPQIYLIGLLTIILLIIFGDLPLGVKNILQDISLLPLLMVINFSMPQSFTINYLRNLLICAVMLIPIHSIIKYQYISIKNLKINIPIILGIILVIYMQYMNIVRYAQIYSDEIITLGGELVTIFLVISISISLFVSGSKYWNKYNSNTMDMFVEPIAVIFMIIVASRVISIIYS